MINAILQYPKLYRLYQKTVRSHYSEYDFFKFIFSKLKSNSLRVLDLCCGDSYILNYVDTEIKDYLGVDSSDKYLDFSKKKWDKYQFLKLDLNHDDSLSKIKKFNPNFIFVNGALHHLDDKTVFSINKLSKFFCKSYFLSVDPVKNNNQLLNKIMISLDRGKFIREQNDYSKLMDSCMNIIIDDFYKMSFKQIFHFKNLDVQSLYKEWKSLHLK